MAPMSKKSILLASFAGLAASALHGCEGSGWYDLSNGQRHAVLRPNSTAVVDNDAVDTTDNTGDSTQIETEVRVLGKPKDFPYYILCNLITKPITTFIRWFDCSKYDDTTRTSIAGCQDTSACNYNADATDDDGSCTYVADCTNKQCGDDGCGKSCGSCGDAETCLSGQCAACSPDCTDKQCGDDGCGNLCGACPDGATEVTITCPADVELVADGVCFADTTEAETGTATFMVTDNCDGDLDNTLRHSDSTEEVCQGNLIITRTWTIESMDHCGLTSTASCDQTITVKDDTPPSLHPLGNVANTIDFDQYTIVKLKDGVESTDDGGLCISQSAANFVDCKDLSKIYSRYIFETGFQDWIFQDISSVDTGGLTAWGEGIEVISADDENWTIVRLSRADGVNFSLNDFKYRFEGAHTYKLVSDTGYEYQVSTDDSGGEGSWGTFDQSNTTSNILTSNFSDISHVDFYSQAITKKFTIPYEYEMTETKWYLDDIELSIATLASDQTVNCDGTGNTEALNAWLANNGGAVASDNCGGVTWSNDFEGLSNGCGAAGAVTVTFTATDDCGKESTTNATFTIEDTTNPFIDTVASDQTVECDVAGNTEALNAWLEGHAGAEASDICGGVTWSNDFGGLNDVCGASGAVTVTFIATDNCSNFIETTATLTRKVAVAACTDVTIVFDQYAIEKDGDESTYNKHNLSAIYSGDWVFEDISSVDTGGLTAWGTRIEVISSDDANWTIVKLSHVDGSKFSLNEFEFAPQGAHTYKLVSSKLVSETGYQVSQCTSDRSCDSDTFITKGDSNFSDISYVEFHAKAITYTNDFGKTVTQTKWKLDDIELSCN